MTGEEQRWRRDDGFNFDIISAAEDEYSSARGMRVFYRILEAPPGYAPCQKYLVAAYETTAYSSLKFRVKNADGSQFASTLKEARKMIPSSAKLCPFVREDWFIEFWEA